MSLPSPVEEERYSRHCQDAVRAEERRRDAEIGSECGRKTLCGDRGTWFCSRTCDEADRHVYAVEREHKGLFPFNVFPFRRCATGGTGEQA